jgi:multicomponent Na+:H+ antiporter subunit C
LQTLLAIVIGSLYATGIFMILRRSMAKLVIGLAMLSHAANLLIFTAAGLRRGPPPLVPEGATEPPGPIAEPLAQALVLTAIVISFGLLAFTVALLYRAHQAVGANDLDEMTRTDR